MIKDKIKEIIEMLISSTNSGNLNWIENSKAEKRQYHREFTSNGEDGTKYEIEVKFIMSSSGTWQLESSPSLWIKSEKLPNGSFFVYGGEDYDTKSLRDVLKTKYCPDMYPSEKVVEDALDSISKGISTEQYRESKINKIFDEFRG